MASRPTPRRWPATSLRLPVTPQNQTRLRVLRQAELAAWNASATAGFDTGQFERRRIIERERRDLRIFGLIALLAMAIAAVGLLKSAAFAEQWAGAANFIQRWLN